MRREGTEDGRERDEGNEHCTFPRGFFYICILAVAERLQQECDVDLDNPDNDVK